MSTAIPLVADPNEVARLAPTLAAAHWALYDALAPRLAAGDAELVNLLDRALAEVMPRIDCTTCGRCCREMGPIVSSGETARLAKALGLSSAEFQARFLRPMWPDASEYDQVWLLPDPCPLHDGLLCTVYEQRPRMCRDFPQIVGADPVERLAAWAETARICPITFNTMERLRSLADAG